MVVTADISGTQSFTEIQFEKILFGFFVGEIVLKNTVPTNTVYSESLKDSKWQLFNFMAKSKSVTPQCAELFFGSPDLTDIRPQPGLP